MFTTYRAKELAEVEAVGNYHLKVRGTGETGTESRWIMITPSELEAIIAVLEPGDYIQAVEPEIRVSLPKL